MGVKFNNRCHTPHGFTFTRSGVVGAEIGWRVGKVDQ